MRGRHLIAGILNFLFGWATTYIIIRAGNFIEFKKKILYFLTSRELTINLGVDDISTFVTRWWKFDTCHLIVNGRPLTLSPSAMEKIRDILRDNDIAEAPLIYSTDSKEPARVLQLGRELLYSISGQIEWPYADVSYNVAELKPKTEYLIVNSVAIFVNNSGR